MFEIRVNGEVVKEIDIDPRLVIGAHVYTPTGEVAAAGFSLTQNFLNITLDYQVANSLEVMEDDARLAKAQAVQDGTVTEVLSTNENARREEALKALALDQAERSANSTEDLSVQFGLERDAVIADSSIYPPGVTSPAEAAQSVVDARQDAENTKQDKEIEELQVEVGEFHPVNPDAPVPGDVSVSSETTVPPTPSDVPVEEVQEAQTGATVPEANLPETQVPASDLAQ